MTAATSETLTALRKLAVDWKREGVAEFDTAAENGSPMKVAEAARQLRCAWELERVLATVCRPVDVAQPVPPALAGSPQQPERVRVGSRPPRLYRMISASREIVRAAIQRSTSMH